MKSLEFWQQRLVQAIHDPVHKAILLNSGVAHGREARRFAESLIGEKLRSFNPAPDWIASGADRPVVGSAGLVRVDWRTNPLITHPLQPGAQMLAEGFDGMPLGEGAQSKAKGITDALIKRWNTEKGEETSAHVDSSEVELSPPWRDEEQVRRVQLKYWRQIEAITRSIGVPTAWLPADTRCPDHGIESHLRVATAAAFAEQPGRKGRRTERQLWLVQMGVRGVQDFIAESRKTRDFWTSCMIFSELVWAAMAVVVEQYGPEAILYPDLRGNPMMDQWLLRHGHAEAVPDPIRAAGAPTYAAPIPNTFMALVPRGGEGHLPMLATLAERCEDAVKKRWGALSGAVRRTVTAKARAGAWTEIWDRQLAAERAPTFVWSAVRWRRRLHGVAPRTAPKTLPGQPASAKSIELEERDKALRPWVPAELWQHYEHARDVYWAADTASGVQYHSSERGFDYAIVHHQLRQSYALRKSAEQPVHLSEAGEKCCLTGRDEVLSNDPARPGSRMPVHAVRKAAKDFWKSLDVDGEGTERLGGPGTFKRLLAQTKVDDFQPASNGVSFPERWAGIGKAPNEPSAPFPSTASLAASRFLDAVARTSSTKVTAEREAFVESVGQSSLPDRTTHLHAHPRMSALTPNSPAAKFAQTEAQYLDGDALQTHVERHKSAGNPKKAAEIENVIKAASALRDVSRSVNEIPGVGTDVGVLAMDGDGMSRLLIGDPSVVRATWRDVLHPDAVAKLVSLRKDSADTPTSPQFIAADAWAGLLDRPRHMGPSLHAAITQSLAIFVHEIAAWVVECEFHGRLVYAGGDDVLAMLPLADLIPAATRLQQLFSAPFVIDTEPSIGPWSWRTGNHPLTSDGKLERTRFAVPIVPEAPEAIRLSVCEFEPHAGTGEPAVVTSRALQDIRIIPMLGRAHSMSAGIAFGHFKTPLERMIQTARYNLNEVAKKRRQGAREQKSALAITHFTRSGAKATFCAGWEVGGGEAQDRLWTPQPPALGQCFSRVANAFSSDKLSARMPYKLRETVESLGPAFFSSEAGPLTPEGAAFLTGWLKNSGGVNDERLREDCFALAEAGQRYSTTLPIGDPERTQALVAGLLLARHVASDMCESTRFIPKEPHA